MRYEKKLADELEKEKNKTERTLKQVKEEYREELERKKREVAHERLEMEERIREKERTLQHMMDIRAMNKEGSLDVQRKVLENRQTELKLAAERLDKANEEFRKWVYFYLLDYFGLQTDEGGTGGATTRMGEAGSEGGRS